MFALARTTSPRYSFRDSVCTTTLGGKSLRNCKEQSPFSLLAANSSFAYCVRLGSETKERRMMMTLSGKLDTSMGRSAKTRIPALTANDA